MCTKRKELDNFKENVAFSKDGGAGETERSVAWDKKGVDDGVCVFVLSVVVVRNLVVQYQHPKGKERRNKIKVRKINVNGYEGDAKLPLL